MENTTRTSFSSVFKDVLLPIIELGPNSVNLLHPFLRETDVEVFI